jgi:hypothetical protein
VALIPDIEDWTSRLAEAIAAAVREFAPRLEGQEMVAFDVGCFPWHGTIELSILTAKQAAVDPGMLDPREVAAWPHYNFAAELETCGRGNETARSMASVYRTSRDEDRAVIVAAFLSAIAVAVNRQEVVSALSFFKQSHDFRITVLHPDEGTDHYSLLRVPGHSS